MLSTLRQFCLLVQLVGGALAIPTAFAADYLLFGSTVDDTKGFVCRMDMEGNLTLNEVVQVGLDTRNIGVSPNGRIVVFAGNYTSPTLSVFFIRDNGQFSHPVYLQDLHKPKFGYNPGHPVVFHASLPLFYSGWSPVTSIFRYNSNQELVEPTGWALDIQAGDINFGYSPYSGCLVCAYGIDRYGAHQVRLNSDGSFGEIMPAIDFPGDTSYDFAVSPDGRWAAGTGIETPEVVIAAVGRDGTMTLADTADLSSEGLNAPNLEFSSDSRYLYMTFNGTAVDAKFMISFAVDPQTGKLKKVTELRKKNYPGCNLGNPLDLTITPDGRFAAFHSWSTVNVYRNKTIYVARLYEDGSIQLLPEKRVEVNQFIGALAFAMAPPQSAAGSQWASYE